MAAAYFWWTEKGYDNHDSSTYDKKKPYEYFVLWLEEYGLYYRDISSSRQLELQDCNLENKHFSLNTLLK